MHHGRVAAGADSPGRLATEAIMKSRMLVLALWAAVLPGGCSNQSEEMMGPSTSALVVRPVDGETRVRLDAEISLTFAAPVERGTIESGFHLFNARDMADTTCPHPTGMRHGGMSEAMHDSALMRHMMENHAMRGGFRWSGDGTQCVFRPDTMMAPGTLHMMHFGPQVMDMVERHMPGTAMHGHGSGEMARHTMYRFSTTGPEGGHGGHHRGQ
jgi:hypothetical protein